MKRMYEKFTGVLIDHPVVIMFAYLLSSFFASLYFKGAL